MPIIWEPLNVPFIHFLLQFCPKSNKLIEPKLFEQHPNIDWEGIKGLRNILAHNYFSIDAEEIYRLCFNEIEPFKREHLSLAISINTQKAIFTLLSINTQESKDSH